MKVRLICVALLASFFAVEAVAQTNTERAAGPKKLSKENPGTLMEVFAVVEKSRKDSEALQSEQKTKPLVHLTTVVEKFFVKAALGGELRKIPDEKRGVLELWFAVPGRRVDMLQNFENEYLVIENKQEYWLPVNKRIIEWMPPEIKKGDTVTLEIVWLGGRYTPTGFADVFIIDGFSLR